MPYFVYILQSESTGKTYVGQTDNLERRVSQHNDPNFTLTLYTKRNKGPWRLIHSEEFSTRVEAMRREKYLKSGQGREWIRDNLLKPDAGGCYFAYGESQAEGPPKADSSPVRGAIKRSSHSTRVTFFVPTLEALADTY